MKLGGTKVKDNKRTAKKKTAAAPKDDGRKNRNFPKHTLEAALVLPQKIQDEMGGKPMNRLLLVQPRPANATTQT